MISLTQKSLYIEALDLWVDSMKPRDRCYVSHGHADHARPHGRVVLSTNSARICRLRFGLRRSGGDEGPTPIATEAAARAAVVFEEHDFEAPWKEGDHRLMLFSAGHVLGSAQLLVEGAAGRFVYTGDFKLAESLTAEPPRVERCDVVLMECTFGRPLFAFPPRAEIVGAMIDWARETLEAGATPVFKAYSLGKAQEAMAILGGAGFPLTVHGAIASTARVYEEAGVALPPWSRYDAERGIPDGHVVVWPPAGRSAPKALRAKKIRTAMLSGWAMMRGTAGRYGADTAFPLSDHADFPALLRYVELAQPKKVLLNHGGREFVSHLRRRGVDAEYLEEHAQLALF